MCQRFAPVMLVPVIVALALVALPALAADVEYNTTGTMNHPATQGGDYMDWGSDFLARWDNDTGHDVLLQEFGWPCGGWWSQFWFVWITDTLPEGPFNFQYHGSFVAASASETEYPPRTYTYIDVSEEDMVVPAGASMYFGYGNPGMGGQINHNGVTTWSYLDGSWDMDSDFGRTAVMQFKGAFVAPSAVEQLPEGLVLRGNHPNPFNPRTTIAFSLDRGMEVTAEVISLSGRRVCTLLQGRRLEAGRHEVVWNGTDSRGGDVSSGIYFLRLVTPQGTASSKMILAR